MNSPSDANAAKRQQSDPMLSELAADVREIAESIVSTDTQEGRTLLRAADVLETLGRRQFSCCGSTTGVHRNNCPWNIAEAVRV